MSKRRRALTLRYDDDEFIVCNARGIHEDILGIQSVTDDREGTSINLTGYDERRESAPGRDEIDAADGEYAVVIGVGVNVFARESDPAPHPDGHRSVFDLNRWKVVREPAKGGGDRVGISFHIKTFCGGGVVHDPRAKRVEKGWARPDCISCRSGK